MTITTASLIGNSHDKKFCSSATVTTKDRVCNHCGQPITLKRFVKEGISPAYIRKIGRIHYVDDVLSS